jgi:predicted dehydrogenase
MTPERKPINVAVIGAGAFGRNHARIYHQLQKESGQVRLVAIADLDPPRAASLAQDYAESGTRAFGSIRELIKGDHIQAASVTVPTVEHLKVAGELMEAGVDVLIEKPLAATLADADELVRLARRTGRIAQVGHLERFNPAVRTTRALLTRPMFFEVHRMSVFTPRSLDIDVVLDLMIHDLDVVLSFVNSPVKEIRAVGLPILSGKVDIANVRMEFESGCVANFTASRVSTERIRKLRFFQPKQYISIDYSRQDVLVFTVAGDPGKPLSGDATPLGTQIQISKPAVHAEEPLRAELRAFVEAVQQRSQPLVSLEEGRNALALALEIVACIGEHSSRVNLSC